MPDAPAPRGRPADPTLDATVRDAAAAELAERGWHGMSVERLAARAGVARTTVYRRYGSLHGVLLLMMGDIYADVPVPDTGSVRDDLVALMLDVVRAWRDPARVDYLAALAAAQRSDADLAAAYDAQFRTRRRATIVMVHRGVERGELPAGCDGELLLDLLSGVVAQRVVLNGAVLPDSFAAEVVDAVLGGFR
ncbi:transcriptional regulator, TetR family [Jatrophihabitans endophyticus]|uniref:Transcriptional regulator, TetR family n=1 Tax=Jatrophihabitans endophyticus TaxID=1206085 RepID=A0A1M5R157_9ACTN|nr:TetR/AcrR family transcriptional regulator [Jatrophihabitans endophyticus]SHH20092.1 transcriptional regulator, TetR family [Jatrophihabitans endophyticus]